MPKTITENFFDKINYQEKCPFWGVLSYYDKHSSECSKSQVRDYDVLRRCAVALKKGDLQSAPSAQLAGALVA